MPNRFRFQKLSREERAQVRFAGHNLFSRIRREESNDPRLPGPGPCQTSDWTFRKYFLFYYSLRYADCLFLRARNRFVFLHEVTFFLFEGEMLFPGYFLKDKEILLEKMPASFDDDLRELIYTLIILDIIPSQGLDFSEQTTSLPIDDFPELKSSTGKGQPSSIFRSPLGDGYADVIFLDSESGERWAETVLVEPRCPLLGRVIN